MWMHLITFEIFQTELFWISTDGNDLICFGCMRPYDKRSTLWTWIKIYANRRTIRALVERIGWIYRMHCTHTHTPLTVTDCVTWMHRHSYIEPNKSSWHWCKLFAICICIYITFPSLVHLDLCITLSPLALEETKPLPSLRWATKGNRKKRRGASRKECSNLLSFARLEFIFQTTWFGMCDCAGLSG